MADALVLGIPSKGRIHDETMRLLERAGSPLERGAAGRGYSAALKGMKGVEVRLLSAGEIAASLDNGSLDAGITGLDLLHERVGGLGPELRIVARLGFSRARVVVAVPDGWIDVETVEDLRDAAARYHERTRARLRVATKFRQLTRRFFAEHGLIDYRIVASLGATEGAPAGGTAELVVDITETGATLAANGLRILSDGVILESEAVLAGSRRGPWPAQSIEALQRLCLAILPAGGVAAGLEAFIAELTAQP